MNKDATLWERYRAMFALRNLSKTERAAVDALCVGFQDQDSALFRHEVAFVLGQVGPAAAGAEGALTKVVEDDKEHPMVRHEAVEALGAIDTEGAIKVLKKYLDSPYRIVRERSDFKSYKFFKLLFQLWGGARSGGILQWFDSISTNYGLNKHEKTNYG